MNRLFKEMVFDMKSVNLWHKLIKMRRVDINLQEKKQLLWLLLQNLS